MHELSSDDITIKLSLIIMIGILAQYIAWRMRLPSIVFLTFFGFILGPILKLVDPNAIFGQLLHPSIEIAVAVILFEGGLNLRLHELKEVSSGLRRLISFGLIFNFTIGSLAAHYIGLFSWDISILMAGILVVTGPTAIIPILRHSKLNPKIKSYLKWEGIINDPLGVLLVALIYQFIIASQQNLNLTIILFTVVKALIVATLLAVLAGAVLRLMFIKAMIPDYLKVPSVLAITITVFILAKSQQDGAGLLASTFLGMYFGNSNLAIVNDLRRFKESISIILVSVIFILLSASIELESLALLQKPQIIFIILATLFIRPVAIFLATIGSQMTFPERVLIGFFGPKGIVAASVAAVFGLRLSDMGYHDAELVLPVVFVIVCSTVYVHSLSLAPLAKALSLQIDNNKGLVIAGASNWAADLALVLQENKVPVLISDINWKRLKGARHLGLNTHYGQILLDVEDGRLDTSEYRYLLSATNNDSYNTLICQTLSDDFEHNNIFQLPLHQENDPSKASPLPNNPRGHSLNDTRLIYEELREKHKSGAVFKSTHINETYTFENFQADHADPIFLIITESGRLIFPGQQNDFKAVAGSTIISFSEAKKL